MNSMKLRLILMGCIITVIGVVLLSLRGFSIIYIGVIVIGIGFFTFGYIWKPKEKKIVNNID